MVTASVTACLALRAAAVVVVLFFEWLPEMWWFIIPYYGLTELSAQGMILYLTRVTSRSAEEAPLIAKEPEETDDSVRRIYAEPIVS